MSIATNASQFTLPAKNPGVITVFEYMVLKFPHVDKKIWQQRMQQGKVHWHDGTLIHPDTVYTAQQRVYYYREVTNEIKIPFDEHIIFEDEQLLVAFKPHFLPVIPGGKFVNECLQTRLRDKMGLANLQALHRLDRVTAGLLMFSKNIETREVYHQLFAHQRVRKIYQAVAKVNPEIDLCGHSWQVKKRMAASDIRFVMQVEEGEVNSHSQIRCVKQVKDKALFELQPITGKTHQLRVHMAHLTYPIVNDKYYPLLQNESPDDYAKPLQLLAKKIEFEDPLTGCKRHFECEANLTL